LVFFTRGIPHGVDSPDISKVAGLLRRETFHQRTLRLPPNEEDAAVLDPNTHAVVRAGLMSPRSFALTAFALTGFANFAFRWHPTGRHWSDCSERRADLARLGLRALFVGFVVTLLNAAVSGVILE